ncbi:TIGR03032 family protein [Novosphingobium sp. AP12]|uniref:TIGR03032 family protein n=1 Tax=Novosphingobium sp. AP12 TaxID=1144305 RepID=UPI000271E1DF|nr:TIGR03032 family protein [Novosphingobium sp. AP12]EJL35391.1 TIGR03032 family protein [Novosphingobium sp. AP12]
MTDTALPTDLSTERPDSASEKEAESGMPQTEVTTGSASAPGAEAPNLAPGATNIAVSRGLSIWLRTHRLSLAFTSYQTGQLFLVGSHTNGTVSFNQQSFSRAMGVCWRPGRLYLGSLSQLWRLEDMLRPGELGNKVFDAVLVPRNAQTTGDVDIHEVAVDNNGQVIFVNTKYSCLATLDLTHSFKPIWKPPFISKLAPEDRCHLNGMAMADGEVRYVTAVSRSDVLGGWRERRHEGGVLIDVRQNRIVTEQLSMPHSPRVANGHVYVLDSGRGQIVRIDPETSAKVDIAFCPGFLRGMAIHGGHAIVTVSKPRDGTFKSLLLDGELKTRDAEAWCGVLIVNLSTGDIVEWIRLEGHITELFDVAALPGVACPMSVGPDTQEFQNTITFEPI